MKLKIIGVIAGLGLLLPSAGALAHTDVHVDLGFRIPVPPAVVVGRPAHYDYYDYYDDDDYYYSPRVYYRGYYDGYPRHYYAPRYRAHSQWRDHDRDDRGRHGHRHH